GCELLVEFSDLIPQQVEGALDAVDTGRQPIAEGPKLQPDAIGARILEPGAHAKGRVRVDVLMRAGQQRPVDILAQRVTLALLARGEQAERAFRDAGTAPGNQLGVP